MDLNVWHFRTWSWRHYLTHPWKWFQDLWRAIKYTWMRATKGYCLMDVWNLDSYLLAVLPPMFRTIARKGVGYPGTDEFPTPEDWNTHLESVADVLESLQDEKWFEECDRLMENRDTAAQWLQRYHELAVERQKIIEDTFNTIGKNFDLYWD